MGSGLFKRIHGGSGSFVLITKPLLLVRLHSRILLDRTVLTQACFLTEALFRKERQSVDYLIGNFIGA